MKNNQHLRRITVFLISMAMLLSNMSMGLTAFAAETENQDNLSVGDVIGSPNENAENGEELDDTETELQALGFDTDEMPEGYDEDAPGHPYGSDYTLAQEISEIIVAKDRSLIYGEDVKIDNGYGAFFSSGKEISGLSVDDKSYVMSQAACFTGKGRKSDMAYLKITPDNGTADLSLILYNSDKGISSDPISIATDLPYENPMDIMRFSDLDVGDYDGDGLDEIAVFVPEDHSGGVKPPRMSVFKLKADNVNPAEINNWKEVWSYAVPKNDNLWNSVDIVSGDLNNDGADDIVLSWGRISTTSDANLIDRAGTTESESVLLLGDKGGKMLTKTRKLSYGNSKLCRVAFTIDDINGDGVSDAILGGQDIDQAESANNSRAIGFYAFDDDTETLVCDAVQTVQVIEGVENGSKWESKNGYDGQYLSLPGMKANITITQMYGAGEDFCVYLDSVLYKYKDQFTIVDELDDGTGTKPLHKSTPYYEFDASSSYLAGPKCEAVKVSRYITGSAEEYTSDVIYAIGDSPRAGGDIHLTNLTKNSITKEMKTAGNFTNGSFTSLIDTDMDSAVMRYTGKHKLVYSDPKVYAVLASAPYFEDVAEHVTNGSGVKKSAATSWGSTSGSADISGSTGNLTITPHFEYKAFLGVKAGQTNVGYQMTGNHIKNDATNYSMTYSTIAGEDCVVFYSVPAALYEYEMEYLDLDEDGNYVVSKAIDYVTIPYQPVSQTISMDTYNEIQKENSKLPVLDGTAVTSTCGDPSSYPSSTRGMKDALVYKGDWSAPSYSTGGSVTQQITKNVTNSEQWSNSGYFDTALAWGCDAFRVGIRVAFSGGKVTGSSTSTGSTISGKVSNMPVEAKGYGYYFSWKLVSYKYKTPSGDEFPVVTYLTRDVTTPPSLPSDFKQDHTKTTDSSIALKWTGNDLNVTAYDIYRHNEFTEGANDVLVGTVNASDYTLRKNKYGELIYENGKTIRDYSFVDTGLSDYTEYEYRIQVRRSKVPPKSPPSKTLVAKTRAIYHPKAHLSDTNMTVYYDTIKTVTVDVDEDDNFIFKNKSFQWQKYNEATGLWDDLTGQTGTGLKFSKCALSTQGEYRCRINSEISALGNIYRVTAYSNILTVNYSKRDVKFGTLSFEESFDGKSTSFTQIVTNSGDGAVTQPQGYIVFSIDDGQETTEYKAPIDSATNSATVDISGMKTGAYEVATRYEGSSKTFKDANNPETLSYLKNLKTEKWLSCKRKYVFGEDIMKSLKLFDLEENGDLGAYKTDITDKVDKVEIVYSAGSAAGEVYASFDVDADNNTAHIPGYTQIDQMNNKNVFILKAYSGDKMLAQRKIGIQSGDATLYLEDIEGDVGIGAPLIRVTDIRIEGAEGFEDGTYPFIYDKVGDFTAFSDPTCYHIGIYTQTGVFLGNIENTAQTMRVDISKLSPGEYILKIEPKYPAGSERDSHFFNLNFAESSLVLHGNTYYISASGETADGKYAGTVEMTEPEQVENVKKVRIQGGTSVTFKAMPTANYAVKYWIVHESGKDRIIDSTSEMLTYKVQGTETNINVRAIFVLKANRISATALGGGSSSVVECTSDKLDDNQIVAQGKELTFKATAGTGYEFVEWRYVTVDGKTTVKSGTTSDDKSESTVKFTMGDASATVYAVFQRHKTKLNLPEHTRAYYLNTEEMNPFISEGTELPVPDDNMIPEGATVIVRTEGGYETAGEWTVDGVATGEIRKLEGGSAIGFVVPTNLDSINVQVDTRVGRYGITVGGKDDSADISVSVNGKTPESLKSIDGGSTVEYEVHPHRGYVFSYWIVNGDRIDNSTSLYTAVVTGNMNVVAVCEKVDGHTVTANISGEGQVGYEISTASGTPVRGTLSKEESAIIIYKGESITFYTKPDNAYMPSYVVVDGKRTENRNYSYTMTDVSKDTNITIGLEAAVYYQISVSNNTEYKIESGDGVNLEDGFAIGADDEVAVLIKGVKDASKLFVTVGAASLEPESCGTDTYKVIIKGIKKDCTLAIDSNDTVHISTLEDLKTYLSVQYQSSDAVLENDIQIDESVFSSPHKCYLQGTLDGQGHALYGLDMQVSSDKNFEPLFESIQDNGKVKNLVIRDCNIKYDNSANAVGLISRGNRGTIESCSVENIDFNVPIGSQEYPGKMGVITYLNVKDGLIINCSVRNVNTHGHTNGHAVAYELREGTIRNCYAENITLDGNRIENNIFYELGSIAVDNCYYDQGGAGVDNSEHNGKNIWVNGKRKSVGEIAYLLNNDSKEKIWGILDDEKINYPVYLLMNRDAYVPVQIRFRGYQTLYGNGIVSIPTEEEAGAPAWETEDACYGAGTDNIAFESDMVLSKVENPDSDYGVKVEYKSSTNSGIQYFKELGEALKFAAKCDESSISITADKSVSGYIEINDANVTIAEGVNVVIKQSGSVENNGTITLSKGAAIENNGAFQNNEGGILDLGEGENSGSFITNGKFMNYGTIIGRENIKCINHAWGSRTVKKEATYTEDGLASEICNACGEEEEFVIPRKEESVKLELSENDMTLNKSSTISIVATTEPEEHIGRIYWSSDDENVVEVKTQNDDNSGAEATITTKNKGSAVITAEYRNDFGYSVKRSIEITVIPQDIEILYKGEKVSDSAGVAGTVDLALTDGDSTDFTAECKDEEAEIKWSSSDDSVMKVVCQDGAVTLSPVKSGTANIVAESDGKQAVCAVRIIVPATEVTLASDSMTIRPGMNKQAAATLSPADSNERLVWTSDNDNIAVVSDMGVVTGVSEGEAVITVTTEGALGAEKHSAKMTVTVDPEYKVIATAKAKNNCTYTGKAVKPAFTVKAVSGEELAIDRDYTVVCTSNVKVGTVTATIKGAGEYAGETFCTYKINPKKTSIRSLTAGKKSFTAKWYKRSTQVTGYQIAYSTSSSFKKISKKTVKSFKATKCTVKKLKSRKTYYVKVRTYKKVGTKTYYSSWSKVKRIKTK